MAWFVEAARLTGEVEIANRRRHGGADVDRGSHRLPGFAQTAEVRGSCETGIGVTGGNGHSGGDRQAIPAARRATGGPGTSRCVVASVTDARYADVVHASGRSGVGQEASHADPRTGDRHAGGDLRAGRIEQTQQRIERGVGGKSDRDSPTGSHIPAIEIDVIGQLGAIAEEREHAIAGLLEDRTDVDGAGEQIVFVGGIADLQPVGLVGGHLAALEDQHRRPTDRLVGDALRHLYREIGGGEGVSLNQPVVSRVGGGRLGERVVGIKIDDHLVERLGQGRTFCNRKRHGERHGAGSGEPHHGSKRRPAEIDSAGSAHHRGRCHLGGEPGISVDFGGNLRGQPRSRLASQRERDVAAGHLAVGVELEHLPRAADGDREQVAVLVLRDVGTEGDQFRLGERLRHHRHHLGPQIEPEIEVERSAGAELLCRDRCSLGERLQATSPSPGDRQPVGIVGEGLREAENDLILIGGVVDRDAAEGNGDVVAAPGNTVSANTGDADPGADRGRIDLHSRAELDRDLLWGLALYPSFSDEGTDIGECRDKIAGHHLPGLELLQLLMGIGSPPPRRAPQAPTATL